MALLRRTANRILPVREDEKKLSGPAARTVLRGSYLGSRFRQGELIPRWDVDGYDPRRHTFRHSRETDGGAPFMDHPQTTFPPEALGLAQRITSEVNSKEGQQRIDRVEKVAGWTKVGLAAGAALLAVTATGFAAHAVSSARAEAPPTPDMQNEQTQMRAPALGDQPYFPNVGDQAGMPSATDFSYAELPSPGSVRPVV